MCNCNVDTYYTYFMKNGIQRKGVKCAKCHELLDYIPQYNEDI